MLAAGGEGANFQSVMSFAGQGGRTKVLGWTALPWQECYSVIKPILEILPKPRLVAFDSPDIMTTCLANLDGDLSLRVQRIPNHYFIAQIHPAQQRGSSAHFAPFQ
jgi:hypothetical protein